MVLAGVAAVLGSYLVGSIPNGFLIARARGVDIRSVGSGNIGATNVARVLGKKLGLVVLVLDALKGFLPALAATRTGFAHELAAAVGLAAILGHVFPVWLGFRGGKGVATGLGVFVALAPMASLIAVGAYAAVVAVTHISSAGSLVGATTLVVTMLVSGQPPSIVALGAAAWLIIFVRHRGNIVRLIRGKEDRV
jgi:glycerol-3-phosphate acyltransferase PlsY